MSPRAVIPGLRGSSRRRGLDVADRRRSSLRTAARHSRPGWCIDRLRGYASAPLEVGAHSSSRNIAFKNGFLALVVTTADTNSLAFSTRSLRTDASTDYPTRLYDDAIKGRGCWSRA